MQNRKPRSLIVIGKLSVPFLLGLLLAVLVGRAGVVNANCNDSIFECNLITTDYALRAAQAPQDNLTYAFPIQVKQLTAVVDIKPGAEALYDSLIPEGFLSPRRAQDRKVYFWLIQAYIPRNNSQFGNFDVRWIESAISIKVRYGVEEGWLHLSQPTNSDSAYDLGRGVGFPKYMASATLTQNGSGWTGITSVDPALANGVPDNNHAGEIETLRLEWSRNNAAQLSAELRDWSEIQHPYFSAKPFNSDDGQLFRVKWTPKPYVPLGNLGRDSTLGTVFGTEQSPLDVIPPFPPFTGLREYALGNVRVRVNPDLDFIHARAAQSYSKSEPLAPLFPAGKTLADLIETDQTVPGIFWDTELVLLGQTQTLDRLANGGGCADDSALPGGEHPGGDWPSYGQNLLNHRVQPKETKIGPLNVATLQLAWKFKTDMADVPLPPSSELQFDGAAQGTPIVAGGCVYFGTERGNVYALNADTGQLVWQTNVRRRVSTLAYAKAGDGKARVFANVAEYIIEDGINTPNPHMVALDAQTGDTLWESRRLEDLPGAEVTGSPVPYRYKGRDYVLTGISGWPGDDGGADEWYKPGNTRGSIAILDQISGRVLQQTYVIPDEVFCKEQAPQSPRNDPNRNPAFHVDPQYQGNVDEPPQVCYNPGTNPQLSGVNYFKAGGRSGGGVWTTPAVDLQDGLAYFGTGNPSYDASNFDPSVDTNHPNTNALIKVDIDPESPTFGRILGAYQGDLDGTYAGANDLDFGASPNLVTAPDGRKLVAAIQKSGTFHVANAADMRGVWKQTLGALGTFAGNAATAATDGRSFYAPTGPAPTAHYSLDILNGGVNWAWPTFPQGLYGPATYANGVVYTSDIGFLRAADATTGAPLMNRPVYLDVMGWAWSTDSGVAVARNAVYMTAGGYLAAFRLPVDAIPGGEVDTDLDGIPNHLDNCALIPNEDQADADRDGAGDACDFGQPRNLSPSDLAPRSEGTAEQACKGFMQMIGFRGTPYANNVCDRVVAYLDDPLAAYCGLFRDTPLLNTPCPQPPSGPDSDGDGVPDERDQCPGTEPGQAVDGNGCPTASGGATGFSGMPTDIRAVSAIVPLRQDNGGRALAVYRALIPNGLSMPAEPAVGFWLAQLATVRSASGRPQDPISHWIEGAVMLRVRHEGKNLEGWYPIHYPVTAEFWFQLGRATGLPKRRASASITPAGNGWTASATPQGASQPSMVLDWTPAAGQDADALLRAFRVPTDPLLVLNKPLEGPDVARVQYKLAAPYPFQALIPGGAPAFNPDAPNPDGGLVRVQVADDVDLLQEADLPKIFPAGTSLADLIDTDQVATGTHAFFAVSLNSETETIGSGGYNQSPGNCTDDADCDGVPDSADNCPTMANADQADFDGDGIGDACELDEDEDRLTFESGCRDIARIMGLGGSVLEDAVCGVVLASLDGAVNALCNVFSFIPGADAFCPVYSDGPGNGGTVVIGQQIVVQDADARVVIERNPFRLKFVDPVTGQTVLQQVAQGLPAPQPIANADPEPGGFDFLPEHAVYEPLSFELGAEADVQHPVFLYTGNMLAGAYAGVVHHATQVRAARATADGKGVLMTVATTDPTRDLTVRIELDKGSAIRVRANPSNRAGVMAMGDSFVSTANEAFHGFGGRHNSINQRGQAFYGWVEEEGINANFLKAAIDRLEAAGGDRYIFPNGPHQAYYVQNLFMSSNPYGFLLNQTELSRWRMAADREDAWQVRSRSSSIDYSVAIGTPQKVAGTLGQINGRHRLPERWSMGPALKRNVQQGSESVASYTAKVQQDLLDIKHHIQNTGLRIEGYSFEGWDSMDPAVVADINRQFNEIGVKTIGYVRAYANNDGVFDPQGFFEEAVLGGYCVELAPGVPFPGVAAGAACLIDFTNPAAVEWFRTRKLKKMLDLGFDGFMQDFGEQVLEPMRFHDGSTGAEMHNQYPVLYHRLTREFLDQYQADCPRLTQGTYTIPSNNQRITPLPLPCGKFFMYTRTGFSGRQGSVAYEDSNFPGDESTDWTPSTGIQSLAPDMLNRVIGGAFGFNTDIGGYFDQFAVDVLDDDLFGRWSQWAALTPFFRLHNSSGAGTRMPWVFTGGGYDAWKTAANLHVEARPLIRRLWQYGIEQGPPPTRPMWMAYPADAKARVQEQQWMLGDNILVAPVVVKAATSKPVYFPAGTWARAVHDGSKWIASSNPSQRITGPQQLTVPAPADQLPFFFRIADASGAPTGVGSFADAAALVCGQLQDATVCSESNEGGGGGPIGSNDSDGDGIPNLLDNCPTVANPGQEDTDGDGVGDACESAPPGGSLEAGCRGLFGTTPLAPLCDTVAPVLDDVLGGEPPVTPPDGVPGLDGEGGDEDFFTESCEAIFGSTPLGVICAAAPVLDTAHEAYCGAVQAAPLIGRAFCADTDGDGEADIRDNCKAIPNPDQADSDGDGFGDACDAPPPTDADGDGVSDSTDNCPAVANPNQADTDGDGIGDACDTQDNRDTDGDGVQNHADLCPDEPGPASNNGCPLPPPDTTPDPFGFTNVSGVSQNTVVSSNVVTITGMTPGVPVEVTIGGLGNPQYRVNGGSWVTGGVDVRDGDTVQVRHTSANAANTVTETTLTIGGVSGKFRSTTSAGADTDPDAFTFGTKSNVTAGVKVASDPITPMGYDAGLVKPGAGTEYKLDCTLANASEESGWRTDQQMITQGQSICVRHMSASAPNTLRKTSLQIGRTVGYFTTRTAP